MLERGYFMRQIETLLKFARQTSDPFFAAFLMDKAVDLKSQADEAPSRDVGPRPPDVVPENGNDGSR